MIFLENAYEFLLVIHALATILLTGSLTHVLFITTRYLRGRFERQHQEKRFLTVSFFSFIVVYLTGALTYPAFRIYVRHHYFDPHLPWATGLFEVKEHLSALMLVFIVAAYFLRRTFSPIQERQKLYLHIPLCILLNVGLWYKMITGFYLTLLKGSWE